MHAAHTCEVSVPIVLGGAKSVRLCLLSMYVCVCIYIHIYIILYMYKCKN